MYRDNITTFIEGGTIPPRESLGGGGIKINVKVYIYIIQMYPVWGTFLVC